MGNAEYIRFLGQDAQVGLMYYGFRWGQVVFQDERRFDYSPFSYNPAWEAFYSIGTPVNMLTYFLEKYNGQLPAQDTYEYWNEDGTPATTSSEIYYARYYAGYDYNSVTNKVVFYGGITADSTFKTSMVNAISRIGYTGYDISGQPSELDYSMAELYFFKPLDLVPGTLQASDGTGWLFDLWGWGYRCFPNYLFNAYDTLCRFNNAGSLPVTSLAITPLTDLLGKGSEQESWFSYPNPFLLPGGLHTLYKYIDNTNNWNGGGRFHDYPEDWEYNPEPEPDDPYDEIVTPPDVGGGGGGEYHTDNPHEHTRPTVGALDSGMVHAYAPESQDLYDFSSWLWTDDFIDNIEKLMGDDPINGVIALLRFPFSLVPWRSKNKTTITVGNVSTLDVEMYILEESMIEINAGTVSLEEIYGDFRDYSPYTKMRMYIPFVGFIDLDPNEVFSPLKWTKHTTDLTLYYEVNLFTGEGVARIYMTRRPQPNESRTDAPTNFKGEILIGQYACTMGFSIPVSGADYRNFYKNLMTGITSIVSGIGTASMSNLSTADLGGGVNSVINMATTGHSFTKAGSTTSGTALLNEFIPFIEILSPKQTMDMDGYRRLAGEAVSKYVQVQSISGYTEFETIEIANFSGTDEEANLLREVCRNGIII